MPMYFWDFQQIAHIGIYFHTLVASSVLGLEISGADKEGMWTLDGHPLSSLITRRRLTPFKRSPMMKLRGKWIA